MPEKSPGPMNIWSHICRATNEAVTFFDDTPLCPNCGVVNPWFLSSTGATVVTFTDADLSGGVLGTFWIHDCAVLNKVRMLPAATRCGDCGRNLTEFKKPEPPKEETQAMHTFRIWLHRCPVAIANNDIAIRDDTPFCPDCGRRNPNFSKALSESPTESAPSGCPCGGPPGHIPGGIHCRRSL